MATSAAPVKAPTKSHARGNKAARIVNYALAAVFAYFAIIFSVSNHVFQRNYIFLNKVRFPLFANFGQPQRYGLPPKQTRNLYLESSDGLQIGAWHQLPNSVYHKYKDFVRQGKDIPASVYEEALATYPTFIYLHGNALNRAANIRVKTYKILSESQDANVFAIDYRGFGDSEGHPSEEGVVQDARAAVDYVLKYARGENGTSPGLALMGQSLGTGIAAQCAKQLYDDGIHLDALILLAAFTSLRPLVTEFRAGGVVPLLGWLDYLPYSKELIDNLLAIRFDTETVVREMMQKVRENAENKPPAITVMHADDDSVINVVHSKNIFTAAAESLGIDSPDSIYKEWISTADPGTFRVLIHRSHPKLSTIGLIPGARVVLPRSSPFSFVELKKGGHDHLLEGNADLIKLLIPQRLAGPQASPA